jgi:hypothetical protein
MRYPPSLSPVESGEGGVGEGAPAGVDEAGALERGR